MYCDSLINVYLFRLLFTKRDFFTVNFVLFNFNFNSYNIGSKFLEAKDLERLIFFLQVITRDFLDSNT